MMNAAGVWERLGDEKALALNLRGEREFMWLFQQVFPLSSYGYKILLNWKNYEYETVNLNPTE
jgi:hypothetical protein